MGAKGRGTAAVALPRRWFYFADVPALTTHSTKEVILCLVTPPRATWHGQAIA
jgi:hypothetical protein